jgi:hypothetical protein
MVLTTLGNRSCSFIHPLISARSAGFGKKMLLFPNELIAAAA